MNNIRIFLISFCWILCSCGLFAQSLITFDSHSTPVSLKDDFQWFIDVDNQYSIDTIGREVFESSAKSSFEKSSATIWLRCDLQSKETESFILFSKWYKADSILLYLVHADGTIYTAKSGNAIPKEERSLPFYKPAIRIRMIENEPVTLYLAIKSRTAIYSHFTIGAGFQFFSAFLLEERFLFLFIGCLVVMCFYNFFIFLTSRDINFFYYSGYLLFMILYQISVEGLANYYLWPHNVWFFPRSYNLFISLCFSMALIFTRSFLNLRSYSSFLNKVCNVLIVFYLLMGILCLITVDSWVITLGTICIFMGVIYILFSSLYMLYRRYKPAKYFSLAWVALLAGTLITTSRRLSLIERSFFTEYAINIGNLFEVVLLSMALGDRLKFIQNKRLEAEEALIDANNRILQNRMKPHFLFNSMNIIFHQLVNSPQRALSSLRLLSDNYHFLTEFNDKKLVPLSEEISFLENYLELMKLRWPDHLTIIMEVDESLLELPIPPCILQPLAENAFKYGLKEVENKVLSIFCFIDAGNVYLKVINNSLSPLSPVSYDRSLGNIKQRILRYYKPAELRLFEKDRNITAEITFPFPGGSS